MRFPAIAAATLAACTTTKLGHVQATWAFADIDANGQQTGATCPPGFEYAALHTALAAPDGSLVDPCIAVDSDCYIDVFECGAGSGVSSGLPPQTYLSWLSIIEDDPMAMPFAVSEQQLFTITDEDVQFETTVFENGGAFRFEWSLVGANSGQTLTCAQAGAATIDASVTIGTQQLASLTDCDAPFGYSAALPPGSYTLALDPLNGSHTPLGNQAATAPNLIGTSANAITDVGEVMLPIAGM
ncbi:MAG TPA: hypothetical protein VMJ10_08695 [Kofleriaceae bacterium]|nr:hypothetical protein [Kofleriaceae bacterium]